MEILREVGEENFYLFGLTAEEVAERHQNRSHHPWDYYNSNSNIKRVMDSLQSGFWTKNEDKELFAPIFQNIMFKDFYLLLADFDSYCQIQEKISEDFKNRLLWGKKSLFNIARSGIFSIDRTVAEYAQDIWHVKVVKDKNG